jgi:transposase
VPVNRRRQSVRDELAERVSLGKTSGIHVLDRFHIMQKMKKAIDEVRASEAKQMKADGYEPGSTKK